MALDTHTCASSPRWLDSVIRSQIHTFITPGKSDPGHFSWHDCSRCESGSLGPRSGLRGSEAQPGQDPVGGVVEGPKVWSPVPARQWFFGGGPGSVFFGGGGACFRIGAPRACPALSSDSSRVQSSPSVFRDSLRLYFEATSNLSPKRALPSQGTMYPDRGRRQSGTPRQRTSEYPDVLSSIILCPSLPPSRCYHVPVGGARVRQSTPEGEQAARSLQDLGNRKDALPNELRIWHHGIAPL